MCTTNVTNVHASSTVGTVLSPNVAELSKVPLNLDMNETCVYTTVTSVPSRVPFPEVPTIVVSRGPPPLIPSTVCNTAWSTTQIENATHVPTTDCTMPTSGIPLYSGFGLEPNSHVRATSHVRSEPSYSSLGFDPNICVQATDFTRPPYPSFRIEPNTHVQAVEPTSSLPHYLDAHVPAIGQTTPALSRHPHVRMRIDPNDPAHRTAPLPVSSVGTHAQIADPSRVVSHSYVPPVSMAHVPSVLPTIVPPAPSRTTPNVKLPKLTMKKCSGDLTKWTTFWDAFSSSIDAHPALSGIDKFNYLISLLESTAAEAISGLTPTEANYEEAVATLKKRFGNPQLIITSHHDIKGLRRLHDSVEAHVRGLRALRVPAQTYGGLLTSVLINKLPPELRLIVTREMTGESWDLQRLMRVFEQEIDARERAFVPTSQGNVRKPRIPTAATLMTSDSGSSGNQVVCVYCERGHPSGSCTTIVDVTARKELLRKSGRCYVCLRRHHLSRDCRSKFNCRKCRGRHHVSICSRSANKSTEKPPASQEDCGRSQDGRNSAVPTTTAYVGSQTPILLQTARLRVVDPGNGNHETSVRAILDSGSQRTYVTSRVRERLKLPTVMTETLHIRTFGDSGGHEEICDVVKLGVRIEKGETLEMSVLVVPLICSPLVSQPITASEESHDHLLGLELADSDDGSDVLEVDMLIGSDWYWSLVTGKVIRGRTGPMAVQSKVGWILSGPTTNQTTANLTLFSPSHTLS